MKRLLISAFVLLIILAHPSTSLGAAPQEPPPAPLKIYLDCYECDTEFLRQNVQFVDYMRDRTDADLHVLVTTQSTGSGGTSWTLKIIGVGRFQGQDRTATFTTPGTATSDERRREFARQFKISVAGYAATTAIARDLDLTYKPPAALTTKAPVKDRWNYWVYRLSGTGNFNGEKLSKSHSYRGSVSATRITDAWKINTNGNASVSESKFTLSDGNIVKSRSDSWGLGGTIVKNAGPRFSIGARVNAHHSSFSNTDRSISIYPGFEFNFFPYSDFQRRSLTIWWEIGPNFYKYRELTVFDKLEERVTKQQMDISFRMRQPWGSMGIFTSISQHLADLDKYSASVFGDASVRLFKGFSFNVYADYGKIKNQIGLPKGAATTEEILLRLRQLATDYRYSVSAGFSYSFGSIFNSVVNPRFGGFFF
jgi:hypothetical protein